MIPDYNLNGVLPPFIGATPGENAALSSPYECTADEIVDRFSSTEHRRKLLRGFFMFRQSLRDQGLEYGYQWIDGSFTENVEADGRDPDDVDVLTLAYRPEPVQEMADWQQFVNQQKTGGIFDRTANKEDYECDTVFVDLHAPPHLIARQVAYWNGLFSHRRETFQWKGMVALPLNIDDTNAIEALHGDDDE